MKLKVLLPTEILIDEEVVKVIAEAENGSFCLLSRHVDFVAAIIPGIFSFVTLELVEQFYAVDEGILIKCGQEVMLSTRNAVRGPDLGVLKKAVQKQFVELEDREKMSRSALARLEAGFIRRFMDIEKQGLTAGL
ncbi:MAG: F0F1 ATP synthase subunit epsilon [Desulfobacteraceae bacterium]|uniref:F0F1 ATP synthase subunit epsilon n=1 Tax=Candidatus Desulfaltia bathyphila TaxID=2841697 RepID=A0A8J6T6G0_9BACT|nr:F0F1 ATP synthase subunit epsilon [Candidatus Desulfaltia bathyphila]MBL7196454.1 F0F1 ATP synthase subunit epsilon [Desulfobacterales bacterium]